MKILIIRNYPSYMDVINNTYNIQEVGLAKALVRKGNICDIVFWTNKDEKEIEIPVDCGGEIHVFYRHGITILKNTLYIRSKKLFDSYDVLQPCEYNQMQAWLLAKLYPNKTLIYHGPYYSEFNKRYNLMCKIFDHIFLQSYIRQNTRFIVKSKLAKDFLKRKGIKDDNICVAGVGMDAQMLVTDKLKCEEPLYIQMKENISAPKILYIGKFEERRSIPFILRVFAIVLKKSPDAKLYMIGNGERTYVEDVWKLAKELGIENSIVWQDKMQQFYLSNVYELADIFLLPTQYEIFGMVLLEAMYYKNVVITTENGGSSTLIKNGINGYIERTLDADKWAELVLNCIDNREKAIEIGKNANNTIRINYTWDKLAEKFENEYSYCIKNNDRF